MASLTSQPTSAWGGRVWSTKYSTAFPPHWILWLNQRTVFSHVLRCRPQHLFID